jgi:hypothetical protein
MEIQNGQRLIDRLVQEGIAVVAACWVRESESGDWYLYLATPLVGEDGATRPAYHRVNIVIRAMQKEGILLGPIEKKVIGPHDPIARDVVASLGRRPPRTLTRYQGGRLGDLPFEEAFVYPPTAKPEKAAGVS